MNLNQGLNSEVSELYPGWYQCRKTPNSKVNREKNKEVNQNNYYQDYFLNQLHNNYFIKASDGTYTAISFLITNDSIYRIIIRLPDRDETLVIIPQGSLFRSLSYLDQGSNTSQIASPQITSARTNKKKRNNRENSLFKKIFPALASSQVKIIKIPSTNEVIVNELLAIDRLTPRSITNFKFGLVYVKAGQTDESDIFNNNESSPDFIEFAQFLGRKITLSGWSRYNGGLDVNPEGKNGEHSIFIDFQDNQIMFHVSTMILTPSLSTLQVERKRHIGNDVAVIIFKEGNDPFSPLMITSGFIHAYFVVRKRSGEANQVTRYTVEIFYRDSMPILDTDLVKFPKGSYRQGDKFRNLLLDSLLKTERLALQAEVFKQRVTRLKSRALEDLYQRLAS